ncbi:emp24/gp25L/p24 family/GOLD-domain-containing protein [Russula compacta]|nr:emp24/gp25L/p24 family/GOLD-domain-containing protein [Russula compacta]
MLDFRTRSPCSLLFCLFIFTSVVNALHFYLDANEKRCFIEELPTDTVVEGHYNALEWNEQEQLYKVNEELGILVQVTEVETGHSVVSTRGPPDGRFTFTSHSAGDHSMCLSTNYSSSWFGPTAHIRLYLDVVVGSTKPNAEHDRSHVTALVSKIRDLNIKIEDIRREQQYQREREADFRNLSEVTNSRALWYSVAQIIVLILTCVWQLQHLRRFFEDRKMR